MRFIVFLIALAVVIEALQAEVDPKQPTKRGLPSDLLKGLTKSVGVTWVSAADVADSEVDQVTQTVGGAIGAAGGVPGIGPWATGVAQAVGGAGQVVKGGVGRIGNAAKCILRAIQPKVNTDEKRGLRIDRAKHIVVNCIFNEMLRTLAFIVHSEGINDPIEIIAMEMDVAANEDGGVAEEVVGGA